MFLSQEQTEILNNLIKKCNKSLDINSSFKEVAEAFGVFEKFDSEFENRKKNSPNFSIVLEWYIKKMGMNLEDDEDFTELKEISYSTTLQGEEFTLNDIDNELWIECINDDGSPDDYSMFFTLQQIANGYLYAHKIGFLKSELKKLNGEPVHDLEQNEEQNSSKIAGLTTKQQILLLKKLGILELSIFKDLTMENKGKLFSTLLNRNEKNVKEMIRNIDVPKNNVSMDTYFSGTQKNLSRVNEVLKEAGLERL